MALFDYTRRQYILSRIKRGVVKKHFNLVFKPTIQTL